MGSRSTPGSSLYTGCFICGQKDHQAAACPQKNKDGKGRTYGGPGVSAFVLMNVTDNASTARAETPATDDVATPVGATEETEDAMAMANFWGETRGMGVLDCGATETIGSISSIEALFEDRVQHLGPQTCTIDTESKRRFRFGNGEGRNASSEATLRLTAAGHPLDLKINALGVDNVPILLSVKTMERLGAVVDFKNGQAIFEALDPAKVVRLHRARSGHLMVDLRGDLMDCAPSTRSTASSIQNLMKMRRTTPTVLANTLDSE
jgi:hypothetical protein